MSTPSNAQATPRAASPSNHSVTPIAFRGACVDLLCRLERRLDQLARCKQAGASFEKLEAAKWMLVELINFAEVNLPPEPVERLVPQLQQVFEDTRRLEELMQSTAWSLMQKFIIRDKTSRSEVDATYEELGDEYQQLFVTFFVDCMNEFTGQPSEKRSMLDCVKSFMDELPKRW